MIPQVHILSSGLSWSEQCRLTHNSYFFGNFLKGFKANENLRICHLRKHLFFGGGGNFFIRFKGNEKFRICHMGKHLVFKESRNIFQTALQRCFPSLKAVFLVVDIHILWCDIIMFSFFYSFLSKSEAFWN